LTAASCAPFATGAGVGEGAVVAGVAEEEQALTSNAAVAASAIRMGLMANNLLRRQNQTMPALQSISRGPKADTRTRLGAALTAALMIVFGPRDVVADYVAGHLRDAFEL